MWGPRVSVPMTQGGCLRGSGFPPGSYMAVLTFLGLDPEGNRARRHCLQARTVHLTAPQLHGASLPPARRCGGAGWLLLPQVQSQAGYLAGARDNISISLEVAAAPASLDLIPGVLACVLTHHFMHGLPQVGPRDRGTATESFAGSRSASQDLASTVHSHQV